MEWKIREAALEDLNELYRIELACFEKSDTFDMATFEFFLSKKGVLFLLAYVVDSFQPTKEEIVGFIIVQSKIHSTYEIVTIDVHPKWQSKGIGKHFLQIIEEKIADILLKNNMPMKSFTIELVVYEENIQAKKLYEKNGYQFLTKLINYYSKGRDGLKMEKRIVLKN